MVHAPAGRRLRRARRPAAPGARVPALLPHGRAPRPGGVGLGLSLVRAIAEAHGGDTSIESRVGRGTRVTVSLPVSG
ncbi:MAG: ATP-binding protein [bacterium]|nr:ATP-binding protein [bacterium]